MKNYLPMLAILLLAGCSEMMEYDPGTPLLLESPVANIPKAMHIKNWPSTLPQKYGQGSCVHASTIHVFKWQGEEKLAEYWRNKREYSGGETSVSITRYLRAEGIPYVSTLNEQTYECSGDPAFLQWVSDTRRAATIWWKPSHACTFVGFVEINGVAHAAVLDNNYPGQFEYHEAKKFIKAWRQFGGFALAITSPKLPPTAPLPWHVVTPSKNEATDSLWNKRIF
jgi:hypothetical protein